MKWNGIVSHVSHFTMATTFTTANANQASSTLLFRKAVPDRAHGFDLRVCSELLAKAPHADLDDVRARIEVVTPDLGEQPFAAHDLPGSLGEEEEQAKLLLCQVDREIAEPNLVPREVEDEPSGSQRPLVVVDARAAELRANPREQL